MKQIILYSLLLTITFSCAPHYQRKKATLEKKLQYWAERIYSKNSKKVTIRGKTFRIDCSNFVRAVYYGATGNDLFNESIKAGIYKKVKKEKVFGKSFGVVLLYVLFKHKYRFSKRPKKGDIIFFDNTYDKNRNKKFDDLLTHTGIVINIDRDRTVTFIHAGTSKGIKIDRLNLISPKTYKKKGKIINSFIQKKYKWDKSKSRMAGELVRGFGRL